MYLNFSLTGKSFFCQSGDWFGFFFCWETLAHWNLHILTHNKTYFVKFIFIIACSNLLIIFLKGSNRALNKSVQRFVLPYVRRSSRQREIFSFTLIMALSIPKTKNNNQLHWSIDANKDRRLKFVNC